MSTRHSYKVSSEEREFQKRQSKGEGEDDESEEQDEEEELEKRRQEEELAAAKSELFGPRKTLDDDKGDEDDEEDEQLSLEALANFSLGDQLDITTDEGLREDGDRSLLGQAAAELEAEGDLDDDLLSFSSDPLINEALTQGVNLHTYSLSIDSDLTVKEHSLLTEYINHALTLASVHETLLKCNTILTDCEKTLDAFKTELSSNAEEIASMQEHSLIMKVKLENRSSAQKQLTHFISKIYLAPAISHKLEHDVIDEDYSIAVYALDRHLSSLSSSQSVSSTQGSNPSSYGNSLAYKEQLPALERTKRASISKIKSFLSARFSEFNERSTSASSFQSLQRALLPYAPLYAFIINHAGEDKRSDMMPSSNSTSSSTSEEIRNNYLETMSKAYSNKFKRFFGDLKRVTAESIIDRHELIGAAATPEQASVGKSSGGLFGMTKKSSLQDNAKSSSTLFSLHDRELALTSRRITEESVDSTRSLLLQANNGRASFERLWRVGTDLLVDNGVHEYDFVVGFFGERDSSADESSAEAAAEPSRNASRQREALVERGRKGVSSSSRDKMLFISLFAKPTTCIQEALDAFTSSCHDPLTVLTLIRVCHLQLDHLHSLQIYFLDYLFERYSMTLGIKFKHLMEAQQESIRVTLSIAPEGANVKGAKTAILQQVPPLITRFADFTASALCLCLMLTTAEQQTDSINALLRKLRNEVDKLINRSSVQLTNARHQLVFQANLYHYISSVLTERTAACLVQQAPSTSSSPSSPSSQQHPFSPTSQTQVVATMQQHDELQFWRDLFAGSMHMWSEEELNEKFRFLSVFTRQFGGLLDEQRAAQMAGYEQNIQWEQVEAALKQFNKTWRESIENVANTISREFGPLNNGNDRSLSSQFARHVLLAFVTQYSTFFELMRRYGRSRQLIAREIVPIANIVAEARKYARI